MLFKHANLQQVDTYHKSWRSNTQYSDYSQQHCIINLKVAKQPDLNCSYHVKEMVILCVTS